MPLGFSEAIDFLPVSPRSHFVTAPHESAIMSSCSFPREAHHLSWSVRQRGSLLVSSWYPVIS